MQTLSAPVLSGETVGEVRAYINDEKFTACQSRLQILLRKKLCILLETIAKTSNIYRQIMTIIL